jgi:hypothetical protein
MHSSLPKSASGLLNRFNSSVGEVVIQYCAKVFAVQRHTDSTTLTHTNTVATAYSIQHDITDRV